MIFKENDYLNLVLNTKQNKETNQNQNQKKEKENQELKTNLHTKKQLTMNNLFGWFNNE